MSWVPENNSIPLKLRECLVCGLKGHANLVQCHMLRFFVPENGRAEKLPSSLCTQCLNTTEENGWECLHGGSKNWHKSLCGVTRMSYILCKHCVGHRFAQGWWKARHNPVYGFKNYARILKDLTFPVVEAGVHGVVHPETGSLSHAEVQDRLHSFFRRHPRPV